MFLHIVSCHLYVIIRETVPQMLDVQKCVIPIQHRKLVGHSVKQRYSLFTQCLALWVKFPADVILKICFLLFPENRF